jgi:hypothetical protein
MEAPVRILVTLLAGWSATLAGVSIRSCVDAIPAAFANAWCGAAPQSVSAALNHQHCAGCVLIAAGLVTMAAAPLLALAPRNRQPSKVSL